MDANSNLPASDRGMESTDGSDTSSPHRHLSTNAVYQPPATWSRFGAADNAVSAQQARNRLDTFLLQTSDRLHNQPTARDQQISTPTLAADPEPAMSFAEQVANLISAPDASPSPAIKGLAGQWLFNLIFHIPNGLRDLSKKFKEIKDSATDLGLVDEPVFHNVYSSLCDREIIDPCDVIHMFQTIHGYREWLKEEAEDLDGAWIEDSTKKAQAVEEVLSLMLQYDRYLHEMGVDSEESGFVTGALRIYHDGAV